MGPRSGRDRVPLAEKKRGDGLERRPPAGIARERAGPRTADGEEARGRLGTPASGRHRAGVGGTAYRRRRRSAGTAWNAGLRPASRGSGRDCAPPTEKKRADGLERRPPAGIARAAGGTAHRRRRRSAGTAWNAGLRPASRAQRAGPRTAGGEEARGRLGTPASGRHRAGARTGAGDRAPCQREGLTPFGSRMA